MAQIKNLDQTLNAMMPSRLQMAGRRIGTDPEIHRMMAGIGARLDPEGLGGAIGEPTMQALETRGQQAMMEELIGVLGKGGKVTQKPDGTSEMVVGEQLPKASQLDTDAGLGTLGQKAFEQTGQTDHASPGTDIHPVTQQKITQSPRREGLNRVLQNAWWNRRR